MVGRQIIHCDVTPRDFLSHHVLYCNATCYDVTYLRVSYQENSMSHVFCSQIAMLLQNKRLLLVIIGERAFHSPNVSNVCFTFTRNLSI